MPAASFESVLPDLLKNAAPKLHALALRMCGNQSDADDLVQEAFLQAQRRWSTFRGDSSPSTWLYAIAARLCSPRLRRKRGGADLRLPALSKVTPFAETTVSARGLVESPLSRVERAETVEVLRAAIVRIPETFRVPLVLTDVLELPVEEVAQALRLKPATVRTRVHRARLFLRREMVSQLSRRPAPQPDYERQVCVDLLAAKLASMDEQQPFPAGDQVLCKRCRAVFHELDVLRDACAHLKQGVMPSSLRAELERSIKKNANPGMRVLPRASQKRKSASGRIHDGRHRSKPSPVS